MAAGAPLLGLSRPYFSRPAHSSLITGRLRLAPALWAPVSATANMGDSGDESGGSRGGGDGAGGEKER